MMAGRPVHWAFYLTLVLSLVGMSGLRALHIHLAPPAIAAGGGLAAPGGTSSSDATLVPRWSYHAGNTIEFSPVALGGRLFVGTENNTLHALDTRTGRLLWTYRSPRGRLWASSLAAGGNVLYVGTEGGRLSALDAATGRVLWNRTFTGETKYPPTPAGDTLYVITTFTGSGMVPNLDGKARLYALRASNGTQRWQRVTDNYSLRLAVRAGNTVFAGGGYKNPQVIDEGGHFRLYAFDADDGRVLWSHVSTTGFLKSLYATGSQEGDTVHYLGYKDDLMGLDARTGKPLWTYGTENWVHGFAAADNRLWFSSANGHVHAVDLKTGRPLWKTRLDGVFHYIVGAPAHADGTLYFYTTYDELYAMDANSGDVLWHGKTGVVTHSSVAVDSQGVYIGSVDGRVYAYARAR